MWGALTLYIYRNYGLQLIKPMPRIPLIITNSIIYLFPDSHAADGGTDIGGSGFLIGMNAETSHGTHCYAVTNAHVIKSGNTVVRINLRHEGSESELTDNFEFAPSDWVCHPNHDLAICPFPPDFEPKRFDCSFIEPRFFVTEKEWREKDIGPGDDVVYVGRFIGHAGRFENMPSVRFGNISMNPNEREPLEDGLPDGSIQQQVAFLVEARSRSGYSGSPVFFLHQHVVNNSRAVIPMFDMRLLGVDFCHIPEAVAIANSQGVELHWKAKVHAGMMGVVPAWYLLDFLNEAPELIAQRKRDEAIYGAFQPNAQPEIDSRIIEPPSIPVKPGATIDVITREAYNTLSFPERQQIEPSSPAEENKVSREAPSKVPSGQREESQTQLAKNPGAPS